MSILNKSLLTSICLIAISTKLHSIVINEHLEFNGFLRTRFWNVYTNANLPERQLRENSNTYSNYVDLFYRAIINIKPLDTLAIHTVFDVITIFGGTGGTDYLETIGGSLGRPGTNFVTRSVYGDFRLKKNIDISFGLLPFSFTGGYILATNGAGVRYQHRINKWLNVYFYWIKVVEHSLTDSNLDGLGDAGKSDDDVLSLGNKLLLKKITFLDMYYIFRYDQNDDDDITGVFHWLAIHSNTIYKKLVLETAAIYNFGNLQSKQANQSGFLNAGLWAIYIAYMLNDLEIGLRNEGASGNNIRNQAELSSFQTISQSRGLSYIFADNSGGLAIRPGGKLFAANTSSLEIVLRTFNDIDINLKYFHHRSLRLVSKGPEEASSYLGDEINTFIEYHYTPQAFATLTASAFWPNKAYQNWTQTKNRKPLIEVLLKCQIEY